MREPPSKGAAERGKELPRPAEDRERLKETPSNLAVVPEAGHPGQRGRKVSILASEVRGSEARKVEVGVVAN